MKKLEFKDHLRISKQLKRQRKELIDLVVQLGKVYPKNSKVARIVEKARKTVDGLRCELENLLFREYPKDCQTGIYYGDEILSDEYGFPPSRE